MRILTTLAAALGLLFVQAEAPAQGSGPAPDEEARLSWVAARGRLLFELDRAAWVGTDDMMARVRDPVAAGMRGYIVERVGEAYIVTFFGGEDEAPVAIYRGRVENRVVTDREVFEAGARPALDALQRRLAAARLAASQLDRRPCGSATFNTAIIPPEGPDAPIDLYLLSPQVRDREWPLGGHYRATLRANGTVESHRAFSNTCLPMAAPEGAAALGVTHLLDPIPTEIHVFTSLTAELPVYVVAGAPQRVWAISGDAISLVE